MRIGPNRPPSLRPREPQLAVAWEPRGRAFATSLRAFLAGPKPPRGFPAGPYFGGNWVIGRFPGRAVLASVLWHIALLVLPWPHGNLATRPMEVAAAATPRYEITWELPARDLPPIPAPGPASKPSPPGEPDKPLPQRGADAYHPRQTIISAPRIPTHPRQTLIRPDAPQIAPKILPAIPNLVQWSEMAQPARPKLQINPEALAKLRPKAPASRPPADVPVPEVPNAERQVGELNIAATADAFQRPRMPVVPMSVPQPGPARTGQEPAAAPEIHLNGSSGDSGVRSLIALSATPGSDLKAPIPEGNLLARVTISPEGTQPGTPGGSPNGTPGATGNAGGGPGSPGGTGGASGTKPGTGGGGSGLGVPGISITGGHPSSGSNSSGLGLGPGVRATPGSPRATPAPEPPGTRTPPSPGFERMKPGLPPEAVFASRKIYTLHVNMPNLTSVTGSWILSFVEIPPADSPPDAPPPPAAELAGPVPLHKVDPRYPPALVEARVQGEVVLYAIIRKDGTVDSIQVVKGLDPDLDQNAMQALARWKFRPAERRGSPVELEAIVHIPFHSMAPNF
jgi:TonB family protein